ncbi:hypothetical protein J6590_101078 [Homalodisca vitripennis]|nr:hypothetical protein J6590_101078 [Homalodisca vitripennis]
MLQQFLIPQIDEDDQERNVFFMQDGAPPHYLTDVWDSIEGLLTASQVNGLAVMRQLHGPPFPRPDTARYFFWGFIKDMVYIPPLLATLPELRARIYAAAEQVTPEMLVRVWEEIHYRWDVCRITNGSHIEHL